MISASDIAGKFPAIARHAERIPRPLDEMCQMYIDELKNPKRKEAAAQLFEELDVAGMTGAYREIQKRHLSDKSIAALCRLYGTPTMRSVELKYLDFPFWVEAKNRTANDLNLTDHSQALRILDIGSGPGHFALICKKRMGLTYFGIDLKLRPPPDSTPNHLYDDLRSLFGYAREEYRVDAQSNLGELGQFDLITCLMGNFCATVFSANEYRPWDVEDWAMFLDTTAKQALLPGGRMYFYLAREFINDDVHAYLSSRAETADRERVIYTFRRES
jgi:SAM-dependent methyltransferase